MLEQIRRADVTWTGDLNSGTGTIERVTSGALGDLAVSWGSRTEEHRGRTSPEELLAAAHAACFSMSLSSRLTKAGHPPERLETSAEIVFRKEEAGWKVAESRLTVRARVPGITDEDFQTAAAGARDGCPISVALQGNVELRVEATLSD